MAVLAEYGRLAVVAAMCKCWQRICEAAGLTLRGIHTMVGNLPTVGSQAVAIATVTTWPGAGVVPFMHAGHVAVLLTPLQLHLVQHAVPSGSCTSLYRCCEPESA